MYTPLRLWIYRNPIYKKDDVKEARNALLSALSAHPVVKYAIVVDEDINIRDEREVLWALATRSGGDEDIIVIPKTFGHIADPASNGEMINKVGYRRYPSPREERGIKKSSMRIR